MFLEEETRDKTIVTRSNTDPILQSMFHPCQLEKRFGGEVDTPKNFWPPYVGQHFMPPSCTEQFKYMDDDEYLKVLKENPELPIHPSFISQVSNGEKRSRDFMSLSTNTSTLAETAILGN